MSVNVGLQTKTGWATGISAGGPDESSQTVTFTVTNNSNALFLTQPAISSTGTLTYKPVTNLAGVATVTVKAQDSGGGVSADRPSRSRSR